MPSIARFAFAFALLAPAFPQTPPFTFAVDKSQRMSPATGAPYSADEVFEHQRTGPDGTPIAEPPKVVHVYRDSQGRLRKDYPVPGTELAIVEIQDPVARCKYVLDPQTHIAHRLKPPILEIDPAHRVSPKKQAQQPAPPLGPLPVNLELLGTREIEGVIAEGTRMTMKASSGSSKHRHRRSTETTIEVWNSPDLEVRVLTRSNNAGLDEATTKLVHIHRSEPDAALFRVPEGYTVVDETDSFSIVINHP